MPPPPYGGYGAYGGYGYGGYGPYGGYGRPAAPKPGLIPLRPLTVGEILDGAYTAIRWNPKTILTSSAVVAAITGVLLSLVTYFVRGNALVNVNGPVSGGTFHLPGSVSSATLVGVTALVTYFANTILTGLLTVAIGQGALGRKETLGSAWHATRPRIGALLVVVLLAIVFVAVGWGLAVGLSVAVAMLLNVGAHLPAVGVLVGVLGGLTATVFALIALVRWALAIPVVMLEHAGPLASLRRSWQLVRRSSWRVLGILLLTQLIVGIASSVIKMPLDLASGISSFTTQAHVSAVGVIVSAVAEIVATTVTAPLIAGVVVLLYADLRMRREGMDITLQAAAAGAAPGEQSAGGKNPGPW